MNQVAIEEEAMQCLAHIEWRLSLTVRGIVAIHQVRPRKRLAH
jgi:hypothetical protein